MKNLMVVSSWVRLRPYEERVRREEAGECPRMSIFERVLESAVIDGAFRTSVPRPRRYLYALLPRDVAMALEAFIVRDRYSAVISWTDAGALLFALLLKMTGTRKPHVALMFWISKPKKALFLRFVSSHIDRIILWTSTHRDFAMNRLEIPPSKIAFLPYYVDHLFFRPIPSARPSDTICSAGREMRDYPTLIRALRGLPINCHIAAGNFRGRIEPTVRAIYEEGPLPPTITVGMLTPRELRDLYRRSRFVVVPLHPTDSDNGLTVILEAMASGKAVICSRVYGQRDIVIDGETGMYVPPGDPDALREAVVYLWEHPAIAEEMGRLGRLHVERRHTVDHFVSQVREIVEEVATGSRPRDGMHLPAHTSARGTVLTPRTS